MSTAPPLFLTPERAARLQIYIQTYRHYAFAAILPTTERNNTLRVLQAIQGKIIEASAQRNQIMQIACTIEELNVLKTVINDLLVLYAQQPKSSERLATISELVVFRSTMRV